MKMTNKELDIIGRAYQSAFDKLVESLNYNGSEDVDHQLELLGVADTWVNFPRLLKPNKTINEETFRLLQMVGKDADLYDNVRIMFMVSQEKGLLKLMEIQDELSWKTNMTSFAEAITPTFSSKAKFTGEELATSLMERCLRVFDWIIWCVNEDKPIELTTEMWCQEWKGSYQIEKVSESRFK